MALVKDWINGFLARHKVRFDPHDWPESPEEFREFARMWVTALATAQATEAEADAASVQLAGSPPQYRRDHIPAVLAVIKERRAQAGGSAASDRESARSESKGCPHCGGEGLATVYHPAPSRELRVPATVAAHCSCPHGRFMRRKVGQGEGGEGLLRRIPDLANLRGWLLEPPGTFAPAPAAGGAL
jgi:hypothetical protein